MENKGNISITIMAFVGILLLLLVSATLYKFTKHSSQTSKISENQLTNTLTQSVKQPSIASSSGTIDQQEESIQKNIDSLDIDLNSIDTSTSN